MGTSTGCRGAHGESSRWFRTRRIIGSTVWIVLWAALLTPPLIVAQDISGTEGDDVIVVTSGTTVQSVESLGGDDMVLVETGAEVADDALSTGEDADAEAAHWLKMPLTAFTDVPTQ